MVFQKKNSPFLCLQSNLFREGKKFRAEKTLLSVLKTFKFSNSIRSLPFTLDTIFQNVNPLVHLTAKKVGSAVYKIPISLEFSKETSLCAKWVVRSSCTRKSRASNHQLLNEFKSALLGEGGAVQKKKTLQSTAVSNRVYLKYLK